jgi:membrane-associated phospholipid phosphatase
MKVSFFKNWKILLGNKDYRMALLFSILCLAGSYLFYGFSIRYVEGLGQLPELTDLSHEFLPIVNLQYLYVYGLLVIVAVLFFYVLIWRPHLMPFYLKMFAFVYVTRSFCIMLTHMGPPVGFLLPQIADNFSGLPFDGLLHSNDLFFSGHTAYPFMGALLLRKESKVLFWFFLIASVVMALTVLLMRVHYSIDVFAAYFIVYGVYAFTLRFFGKKNEAFRKLVV